MNELVGFIISALLQAIVFTFFTSIFYFIQKMRKKVSVGFMDWIGLSRISVVKWIKIGPFIVLFSIGIVIIDIILQKYSPAHQQFGQSSTSPFRKLWALGLTREGIISALFYSFLQTGYSEEILFRGLVGRKLALMLNWTMANLAQATLFAGLHILIFKLSGEVFPALVYATGFFIPLFFGIFAGYLNKCTGEDTIYPSILAHGLGNFIAFLAYFLYH